MQFSPTGQQWAAATTEGLLVYSLNTGLIFDPWDLQIGITPASVREAKTNEDFVNGNYSSRLYYLCILHRFFFNFYWFLFKQNHNYALFIIF